MDVYPAIDLRAGRCVRLYQGDYERETAYGTDPVAVAEAFAAAGAQWIHVVDLDAARTGTPENRPVIATIAGVVDINVQASGGVRDQASAEELLACGVDRVVLGTAAVENPELVCDLAGHHQVAVGLDVRGRDLAVRGWTQGSGVDLFDLLARYADSGVAAVIVTDIGREFTVEGPDLEGLESVLAATEVPVVGSGGVASLDDLRALARLGTEGRSLAGVVVGRALYEGAFPVGDAVEALRAEGEADGS